MADKYVAEDARSGVPRRSEDLDKEIAAALRLSPQMWAYIIIVISTIVGWGGYTLANTKQLDEKADKVAVEQKFDALNERLKALHDDVREIRAEQLRQSGQGNRE